MKRELENGVVIHQVTRETRLVSNIYCERPFCSRDSRRFLYARQLNAGGPDDRTAWEYVLCEFGTWEEEVVGEGVLQTTISYNGDFYFQRRASGERLEFVRLDMETGAVDPVWTCHEGMGSTAHPTVSADGRRMAYHYPISYDPQRFGVGLVDLETGEHDTILEHAHLCNAHLQFHPRDNRTLLTQLNRGCEYTPQGRCLTLAGSEGATLLLLDALSGETQPLQIGKPYTSPCSGHQTWVGSTHDVIATVRPMGQYEPAPGKGTVVLVAKSESSRQLPTGSGLVHIGSTPCGRYFFGDCVEGDHIAIGSSATARIVVVHDDPEDPGGWPYGQHSHPHAYLTPDFRWMVFNSDHAGLPQIHAAEIPPALLEGLT